MASQFCQWRLVQAQVGVAQRGAAQRGIARAAVTNQVDGVKPAAPGQQFVHLRQPVLAGVDHMHFGVGGKARQQARDVLHTGVDKDDLVGIGIGVAVHDEASLKNLLTMRGMQSW